MSKTIDITTNNDRLILVIEEISSIMYSTGAVTITMKNATYFTLDAKDHEDLDKLIDMCIKLLEKT